MKNSTWVGIAFLAWAITLRAGELKLPDPLVRTNGEKVVSAEQWRGQRRGEILEQFRAEVYGRAPVGRPDGLKFTVVELARNVMGGTAHRKQVQITYRGRGGEGGFRLVLLTPAEAEGLVPCFLLICNRSQTNIDPMRVHKSPFWPAEQILARGYAAAAFFNGEVDPDTHDGFTNGVHGLFDPAGKRGPDAWGTIAAWAWGASRAMDYLETDREIDARRVAIVGHSRGGKTALWAAAEDERFAMAVSNDSGCGGASIARRRQPKAETIKAINRTFPHWFCENYKRYNEAVDDLPVDQHELAALIAPRLLYIASASEDLWADPEGEFLSAVEAGRVYRLFGLQGLPSTRMPAPDSPLHGKGIGYHVRTGKHNLTEYDWGCFMDFAAKHWPAGGKNPR